ncbi:DUF6894 family protein [Methylobacterium nigriterrae]|uniref:DUF6894 family protein n=1 Tax=Methylobacterium nigriterrae TaxID=3127512 RepID=UPI00301389FA
MPRFFIDTDDGDLHVRDDEGQDLPDRAAAREIAIDVLPDMARSELPDGDRRTFTSSVRDESGTVIFRASLSLVAEWLA